METSYENTARISDIEVVKYFNEKNVSGQEALPFGKYMNSSSPPSPGEVAMLFCQLKYQNVVYTKGPACPTIWDEFYCWPTTPAGELVSRPCHEIFDHHDVPIDLNPKEGAHAFRLCDDTGQWTWGNWTNYTQCVHLLHQEAGDLSYSQVAVTYILFVCSLLSLVALLLTSFIFCYFKSLQCSRLRVHQNLVVALIIHSILLIIISSPGVLCRHSLTYVDIDWLCKTILSLKMYAAMASINWMFVEGLLLHSRITVSVFDKGAPFKLYYLIGWGFPLLFIISWSIPMSLFLETPCWKGYGKTTYIWVVTGPMITALLINTVFLVNIVRILVTKLRMSVSIETTQVRKAIKGTALLFPLLGIPHLLFCINPRDDAYLERAYMIINAVLQSSQGMFVAVLYCFMNSEVQTALRNAYLRTVLRRNPNHRLMRGRGLSRTSATYLSTFDTTVSEGARHKVSPSVIPLHEVGEPKQKPSNVPRVNSDNGRIFKF